MVGNSETDSYSREIAICACRLPHGILCPGGFIQAHAAASTITFLRFGRFGRKQRFPCIGAGPRHNQEAKFLSDSCGGSIFAAIQTFPNSSSRLRK
jgi:hypothetical protein